MIRHGLGIETVEGHDGGLLVDLSHCPVRDRGVVVGSGRFIKR